MRYKDYIKSKKWKKFSDRVKKIFPKCFICSTKNRLRTHHISYKRLGREALDDVIVLCDFCHSEVHFQLLSLGLKPEDSFFIIDKLHTGDNFIGAVAELYSEENRRAFNLIRKKTKTPKWKSILRQGIYPNKKDKYKFYKEMKRKNRNSQALQEKEIEYNRMRQNRQKIQINEV